MIYIPSGRKISVVLDLDNLPAKISLPRDKRRIMPLLILSGGWLIIAPFVVVFGPWNLQGWPLFFLFSLLFIVTAIALTIGMAALRRNASQDEVTLFADYIAIRHYGWLKTSDRSVALAEINSVFSNRQPVTGGEGGTDYFVVGLTLRGENGDDDELPVFIHRNEPRAAQFAKRLNALVAAARSKT